MGKRSTSHARKEEEIARVLVVMDLCLGTGPRAHRTQAKGRWLPPESRALPPAQFPRRAEWERESNAHRGKDCARAGTETGARIATERAVSR